MKRKEGESSFEFRQRVKKAKYKKKHQYDQEKAYWNRFHKNASKRATEQNRNLIHDLFGHNSVVDRMSIAGTGDVNQNPQRERTWSEFGRQAAAGAAGAALGFINMNVPGAMIGGTLAARAAAPILEDMAVGDSTQNNLSLMPGTYQGKFALSKNKSTQGLRDKYQKNGGVFIVENYGTVADPDLCFIGHSTYNSECIRRAIGLAMLRKLFKKGVGLDITSPVEELPLKNLNPDSGPNIYKILYQVRTANNVTTNYTHNIANDESLTTLVLKTENGFCLYDNLFFSMSDDNPAILDYVYLYEHDDHLVYRLDLSKEVLNIAMSSHIVIQNRTKGATDGSTSTTQIDVQPLKGPVYQFSVAVPKLKSGTPFPLNITDNNGLILVRNGQLGGTDIEAYKEPLVKGAFQNVVKSGYTRLNPGALKSMTVGADFNGYFGQVMYKLRTIQASGLQKYAYGKSQMVILEEELNSGSTNNITVSYECQHIAGAEFVTTYKSNMQPGYSAVAINNLPA